MQGYGDGRRFDEARVISPASRYSHPGAVIDDPALSFQQKRAILAHWASDACAVESMPALRQPPGARQPISFDAIMDALRRLDDIGSKLSNGAEGGRRSEHQRVDA